DATSKWRAVQVGDTQGWVLLSKLASDEVRYTAKPLSVRASASSSGTLLAALITGTKVVVTAVSGSSSKVEAGGVTGWVSSSHLVAAKPAAVKTSTMRTTAKTWIRPATSSKTTAVRIVPAGTTVTVVDATSKWRAVQVGDTQGWVLLSKLASAPAAASMTTTTSLHMRESASTSADVIVTLAEGTAVSVRSTKGVWYQVTAAGRTGWVHSDYLT
ncbi:SH3 domain-containing protein, partial [Microbacterium sp. 179-B 1A2 NHS]|uniref:SH3 domain-containing protein n=1 Tax=Microbacterium sp. 179-B 1A2 NHS TaxID=3142383 RepID=UPI0039A2324B